KLDDNGQTGFVAKSVVKLGKGDDDAPMGGMNMPGMSMPMNGKTGGSSEQTCACCGTGSSCTCCGSGAAAGSCPRGMDEKNDKEQPRTGMDSGVDGANPGTTKPEHP